MSKPTKFDIRDGTNEELAERMRRALSALWCLWDGHAVEPGPDSDVLEEAILQLRGPRERGAS